MPLTLRYVARSDAGLVRDVNEDSGYAGPYLLAVADGMGGHAAGEVASQAAIEELVQAEGDPSGTDPLETLGHALESANERIRQLVHDDPSREGMGTTVTAFLWTGKALAKGHIGDSRAYLLRDGEFAQITHDHTFVQTLVDEGRISREEAGVHPARSFILKALQGQPDLDPDFDLIDVRVGDRLLVCSDGLDNARVSDDAIAAALTSIGDIEQAANELIRLAKAGGAPDNVTVVLADVLNADKEREPDDTVEAYLVGAAADNMPDDAKRSHRSPGAALRSLLGAGAHDDGDDFEARRYAPQPPRRFRWVRALGITAVLGLIAWAGLTLAKGWVDEQYYVGEHSGEVAIYQGLSQELGPIRLSTLYEQAGGLPISALPEVYQAQVAATIPADDVADAEDRVENLRERACVSNMSESAGVPTDSSEPTDDPTTNPTSDPTNAPTNTPTNQPTGNAAAGPTVTPTSEPTPTAMPTPDFPGLECAETQ